jgi:TRAP-type C4-dicarboxylate transport system permease small subunit
MVEKTIHEKAGVEKITRDADKTLINISRIGSWLGGLVLTGVVALTIIDVTLRYVFNRPFSFSIEVVQIALVVVVFCSVLLCSALRGHLAIDVLVSRFPRKGQAVTSSIVHFLSIGVFAIFTWRSIVYALNMASMGNVTTLLKIPLYPFALFIALCSFLVMLMIIIDFVNSISEARQK